MQALSAQGPAAPSCTAPLHPPQHSKPGPQPRQHRAPRLAPPHAKADRGDDEVSEAVLARLRKAEEEAAALRKELADARSREGSNGAAAAPASPEERERLVRGLGQGKVRVDGTGLNRVVPWAGKNAGDWVNEGDLETAGVFGKATEEERAEVRKRVLLGALGTVLLGAFALVPTDSLRLLRPNKPLFLYLIPVVRSQELLKGLEPVIEAGSPSDTAAALKRISGPPTSLAENARNAAISLPDQRYRERAAGVARDILEALEAIDPDTYFDSPSARRAKAGGEQARAYAEFSLRACRAAQVKVKEFLALLPAEDVRAARDAVAREAEG